MERISIQPRNNWQKTVEAQGFGFHSTNVPYWDESAYYKFEMNHILEIEKATAILWDMCIAAVQFVIDHPQIATEQFGIPEFMIPLIEKTWNEDAPSIYARFDLVVKDGEIKMLECNADTPTSLFEAGIVQWFWLQDFDKNKDQFNSLHEKLIDYWKELKPFLWEQAPLHFSCIKKSLEDLTTTEYLRDCAIQAGIDTKLVYMDDIGWNQEYHEFRDMEEQPIMNIFKLYPWEFLANEGFGASIPNTNTVWIEPAWKMILSNKAILPILYQLYPNSPYLLKSYFDKGDLKNYVKKPILSREGANIEIYRNDAITESTTGGYGSEGYIYQDLCELPEFDGNRTVVGSWIVGQQPAGIGIRESKGLITDNMSRFIPHLIDAPAPQ